MLRLRHDFCDHGLDNANVAVQKSADGSPEQGNPDVGGESHHDHAEHGPDAPEQQDGLAADAIREAAPVHAHDGLGEREGGDEEAGVERGILLIADLIPLDEGPGVGEDGSEGNGLSKADNGWTDS